MIPIKINPELKRDGEPSAILRGEKVPQPKLRVKIKGITPTPVQRVVFKGLEGGSETKNILEEKVRFQALMEQRAAGCQIPSIDAMIVGLRKERRFSVFELEHQLVAHVAKSSTIRKPNLLLTVRLIHAEEATLTNHHSECHLTAKQRAEEYQRQATVGERQDNLGSLDATEVALVLAAAKKSFGLSQLEVEETIIAVPKMGAAVLQSGGKAATDVQRKFQNEVRKAMEICDYTNGKCTCKQGLIPRFEAKLGYPLLGTEWCRFQIGSRGETMMIFLRLQTSFDAHRVSNMIEEFSVTMFPISVHFSSEDAGEVMVEDAERLYEDMVEAEDVGLQ